MTIETTPAADLLRKTGELAEQGYGKREIADHLGIKTILTLDRRLVQASQETGQPIPVFRARGKGPQRKRVEFAEVRQRGKGQSFGVNIPQEPLDRLGVKPGDRLAVTVRNRRIVLSREQAEAPAERKPRGPRLVKRGEHHAEGEASAEATG